MEAYHKQVVLITGCSTGGISHALARAFVARNCLMVAPSRSLSSMSNLDTDDRFFLQELDISSDKSVTHVLFDVFERFGGIDVLVNNAGVQCMDPSQRFLFPRGDCEVYAVKHIELLSLGRTNLSIFSDKFIDNFRNEIAHNIFRGVWETTFGA